MNDFCGTTHRILPRPHRHGVAGRSMKPGRKMISSAAAIFTIKSNYQDFQRYARRRSRDRRRRRGQSLPVADRAGETADRRGQPQGGLRGARQEARRERTSPMIERTQQRRDHRLGCQPRSPPRACAPRSRHQIKDEDWSLVGTAITSATGRSACGISTRRISCNGDSGGTGIGYCAPASLGAALANKKHGRFTVAIQPDGDFHVRPGALWTAAHHKIPMLYVMHNNRAYHQEFMYLQAMASAASARHRQSAYRHDASAIPTSITRPWREALACMPRVRSRIRRISRRRSRAPSPWCSAASPHWSMS